MTVHGDRDAAQAALGRWAAQAEAVRAGRRAAPGIAVSDLLTRWLIAEHGWRPSTVSGYRSVVAALRADPIGARRASQVVPPVLRAASQGWVAAGVGCGDDRGPGAVPAFGVRVGLPGGHVGLRGPSTSTTRLHAPVETIRRILQVAGQEVADARQRHISAAGLLEVHRREQLLLLVRLAADTGARRGEMAALQIGDLDGDVLTISRGTSAEVVGPSCGEPVSRRGDSGQAKRMWQPGGRGRSAVAVLRAPGPCDPVEHQLCRALVR